MNKVEQTRKKTFPRLYIVLLLQMCLIELNEKKEREKTKPEQVYGWVNSNNTGTNRLICTRRVYGINESN